MDFEEYKSYLGEEFPKEVRRAVESAQGNQAGYGKLFEPCLRHHENWGFAFAHEAWEAAVPRSNRLSLFQWSECTMKVDCWEITVSAKAFHIMPNGIHVEVYSKDKNSLPFTATGYRSYFVDIPSFRNQTIEDFVRSQFPRSTQLSLF